MSTTLTKNLTKCPKVIVRAFGGEPVLMLAIGSNRQRIQVAKRIGPARLSLPSRIVYHYDDDLLKKLRSAFEAGDAAKLNLLWGQAQTFGA